MEKQRSFSRKEKIGYGMASLGDTAVYNLLIIYGLFFMTDVVKLNPLAAGNVIFIATLWNAFFVAIIGYISDHHPFKNGKRLPYMKGAILPMAVTLILFFSVIKAPPVLMAGYYTLMMTALMTAHSAFMVPYEALGADLTMNPDERTELRSFARLFMGLGNLTGVVFLLPGVSLLQKSGLSLERAWQMAIFIVAVIGLCSQVGTCRVFQGKTEIGKQEISDEKRKKFFSEYREITRLRPFLLLLAVSFTISIANVFCNSSIAYFMKYNLNVTENSKAFVLAVMTIVGLFMTPVLSALAKRHDKRRIMLLCYALTGAVFLYFGIKGITTFAGLCVYIVVFSIGTSAYWQLIYPMFYDISELDEFQNNRRREATILSMSKIILKLSNASATQMLAGVLFLFGYDSNRGEQSAITLSGIEWSLTLIPGTLFLVAAFFVKQYPITEKRHLEIVQKLQQRKDN